MKTKKQYKLKVWLATLSVALFSGLLAIGSYATENYKQSKAVSYNDNEYEIVLTQNELDNYSFQNLLNYVYSINEDIEDSQDISFNIDYIDHLNEPQTINLMFDGVSQNDLTFTYNNGNILYVDSIMLTNVSNYKFYAKNSQDNTVNFANVVNYIEYEEGTQSTPSFYLKTTETFYSGLKNAIELDITANTPTFSGQIIDAIESGLGLIGQLAQQFLLGFTTLFWTGEALTEFGIFSLCFLGLAISFAIVRLVMNIVRSNTGV